MPQYRTYIINFISQQQYLIRVNMKILKILFITILVLTQSLIAQEVEHYEFTAQVSRLMDIIINSLYTQKQIFLRQVISNASDALDKIRFLAISDPNALGDNRDLEIRVSINQQQKYLSIRDTGVGMTKSELIQNLGTIAKSGTTNFLEALKGGNINLIGQFGVGFYSTFLAGSKVQVISKSNNDLQYVWISQAASSYKIIEDPQGDTLGRGTQVKIYLKQDALDFLKHKKIQKLIRKYSQFIDFPIYLKNKKQIEQDAPIEAPKQDDDDIEVTQKQKEPPKKIKKTIYEWQRINTNKAIWLRDKDQIQDQDYIDFYKSLSKQSNNPLNWIHFKAEGQVEFTSILYLPNRLPYDFYQTYSTRKNDVKLYVRRVLITENKNDLVPKYLSFITGVVDSDELPLNVNRQTLQQSKTFKIINQKMTKRILDMITQISKWDNVEQEQEEEQDSEEQLEKSVLSQEQKNNKKQEQRKKALDQNKRRYHRFYTQFGKIIKLGIIQDSTNRKKLASLARWHTTHNSTEFISLDQYISRMKSTQDQIYFFSGQDKSVLQQSPLVKGLVRKGYEVLLCDDPIDQYVFNSLRDYESKNIVNVGKGDFKLPQDDQTERKKQKYLTEHYKPYIQYAKKLLFEKVNNVILSNRLSNEPCVVVADSYGHSSFMEKIQKTQFYAQEGSNPQSAMKKILEINPHHRVNQIILEKIQKNQIDASVQQLVETLYETAALQSGFSLSNLNEFSKRFYKIYSQALGVLNLERNEKLKIDTNIELDAKDYEGDNEELMRINPSQLKVTQGEDD